MSISLSQPFDMLNEPNEGNIRQWMDGMYDKFQVVEQARWNQSNIDTLFYAGDQQFINNQFNFNPTTNAQNFSFNFIHQPINMVTGYQRQHRKSINYTPIEGSSQESSDCYNKLATYANNYRGILEKFSMGCEQSAIAGMVLAQPFLDYTDDPINGTMDLKIWPYNSFMTDNFRNPDMSDCNIIWCQEFISKREGMLRFKQKRETIRNMSAFGGTRQGRFYFLPENYNLSRNDLLVISYIWFKTTRNKKMLYNTNDGIAYDYGDNEEFIQELVDNTGFFEVIEVEVPTWKQAVVLNDQLMQIKENPYGIDKAPCVPIFWNRDPHIANPNLRVRSLTRSMRDCQFLLNRRIILNHSISESSINTGFYRIENSIVNEEDLKKSGEGVDIIVKEGMQIQEAIQKIIPNQVPPSDMELANQLADFIFRVSGVNQELMGMASDSDTGIEQMLRQGAGLVTLQKYFDQWDVALKLVGDLEKDIMQRRWSAPKVQRITGKEAPLEFQLKLFPKYDVLVSEGLNTTIQQQQEFVQITQLNTLLGGIIPPRFILEKSTIQGKNDIIKAVDEQQKAASDMQQQEQLLQHTILEAQLQNLQAKSVGELATARERHGRAESNIGLFEERLSEITQNRALALKAKVEALAKLMETIKNYGEFEAQQEQLKLDQVEARQEAQEDKGKMEAKITSASNNFLTQMMQQKQQSQQGQ